MTDDYAKPFLIVEDMYNMEGPETKPCALVLEKVIRYIFMNCVSCWVRQDSYKQNNKQ